MTKLEKMLKYVSEHNEFYKNRIKEYGIKDPLDITQWPVLTREELQENRYNMFSDGYKAKYLCHQLKRMTSSGTSGKPISVYWDVADYCRSMMPLWRKRKEWYGVSPNDKQVAFTLSHVNGKIGPHSAVCLEAGHQLFINAATLTSEDAYKAIINRILDFEPKWMYIQPFVLEQLIYYYRKNGFKYPNSLIHIDSVGERLTGQLRRDASDFFNVRIANLYGSEEHNGIAYECPCGNMHVIEDNVYVEKDAVITNVNNFAFPLIRYDQGDEIDLAAPYEFCECGTPSPHIKSIGGRIRQVFDVAGAKVSTYLLSEIIDIVNNQFNGMITKYSFCYSTSKNFLKCDIVIRTENENWAPNIICEIEKVLRQRLPVNKGLHISVASKKTEFATNKTHILTIIP